MTLHPSPLPLLDGAVGFKDAANLGWPAPLASASLGPLAEPFPFPRLGHSLIGLPCDCVSLLPEKAEAGDPEASRCFLIAWLCLLEQQSQSAITGRPITVSPNHKKGELLA